MADVSSKGFLSIDSGLKDTLSRADEGSKLAVEIVQVGEFIFLVFFLSF